MSEPDPNEDVWKMSGSALLGRVLRLTRLLAAGDESASQPLELHERVLRERLARIDSGVAALNANAVRIQEDAGEILEILEERSERMADEGVRLSLVATLYWGYSSPDPAVTAVIRLGTVAIGQTEFKPIEGLPARDHAYAVALQVQNCLRAGTRYRVIDPVKGADKQSWCALELEFRPLHGSLPGQAGATTLLSGLPFEG